MLSRNSNSSEIKVLPRFLIFYNTFRMLFRLLNLNAHMSPCFYIMIRIISVTSTWTIRTILGLYICYSDNSSEHTDCAIHLETAISMIGEL